MKTAAHVNSRSRRARRTKKRTEVADDDPVDIESHGERPSVRAKLKLAEKAAVMRPPIPHDAPFMYRVYLKTTQRVTLQISQLNSAAAFIIVCDDDNRVNLWVGRNCTDEDIQLAKDLAVEVLRRDLRNFEATEIFLEDICVEGEEDKDVLSYILEKCWSDESSYRGKSNIAERSTPIANMPASLSVVEKWDDGTPHLREIAVAYPDANGFIGRMAFAPVEMATMAVLHVGDQWDLWISRGAKQDEEDAAREHLRHLASTSHSAATGKSQSQGLDRIIAAKNVRITRQGCERVLFRQHFKILTDYEPPGKCIPWIPPTQEPQNRRIKERFSIHEDVEEDDFNIYSAPKGLGSNSNDKFSGEPEAKFGGGGGGEKKLSALDNAGKGAFDEEEGVSEKDEDNDGDYRSPIDDDKFVGGGSSGTKGASATAAADYEEEDDDYIPLAGSGGFEINEDGGRRQSHSLPLPLAPPPAASSQFHHDDDDDTDDAADAKDPRVVTFGQPLTLDHAEQQIFTKRTEGRSLLQKDMLVVNEAASAKPADRISLLQTAVNSPEVLIGWQIEIDEGKFNGIHVVTAARRNLFGMTVFRLSSFESDDIWTKLKRGNKGGLKFRPLKKVFG